MPVSGEALEQAIRAKVEGVEDVVRFYVPCFRQSDAQDFTPESL